ncbi:MAG: serine hydrolase domain-containing protein [Bacteroidales bacterium]
MHKVLRSEQIQPIPQRINNKYSDIEDFEYLESGIAFMLGKYDIKGASIAVAKDGKLVFAKGIGYADAETKEPVEPKHLFRIASVSKLITATTIMKMTELGLIDIDDKVFGNNGILNDSIYRDYADPRVGDITVRHLLNHSSGWNKSFDRNLGMHHIISRNLHIDKNDIGMSDILLFALKKRLQFAPGSRTSYSNLGYGILGEIIEAVTGTDYETYVKQTILLPLGIHEMRLGKNHLENRFENEVKYYKTAYIPDNISLYPEHREFPVAYGGNDIESLAAAGGWIASPAEILKLVTAIDSIPGADNILSRESIRIMTDRALSGGQTIGWARADIQGNWWRTGTLSGTSALVKRQQDGISWAVFFNSSTYMGINLPNEINREVHTALEEVNTWPEHDLFYHFETMPYLYPDIAQLR